MNRDLLKKAIKKLVIQEITNNQFGIPVQHDVVHEKDLDAVSKAMGKGGKASAMVGTGKIEGSSENQTVILSKNSDDCYDVVSITNGAERKVARKVSLEDAMELVKTHGKDSEKTYVQKAYDKSLKGFGKKPSEKEEAEEADKMDDADEELQIDIADDSTEKADQKIDVDVEAGMGGDIVDKIEKIVDKVLKNKHSADAKGAYLKHDSDVESPNKLTTKLKDTPALKEKKS